ncbi:MAG: hypothetical protein ACE10G_02405 [Gemmatimonadales bacterium]
MKALLKKFTGSRIRKQTVGGQDEMYDAEVFCIFQYQGKDYPCKASIKQTVGSSYESRGIEVYRVEGLPAGALYDHDTFAETARHYYTERVVKLGD